MATDVRGSKTFIFRPRPGVADGPAEVFFYLIPVEWCNSSACWTHRAGSARTRPPACHMMLARLLSAEKRANICRQKWVSCDVSQKEQKLRLHVGCGSSKLTSIELYRCLEKLYSISRAVKLSTAKSNALSCPLSGRSHTSSHDMFSTVWPASQRMPSKRSSRSTQWYSSHCCQQTAFRQFNKITKFCWCYFIWIRVLNRCSA